ncbi:hypothetical protein J2Z69_000982 [Paenibacillus shirakamiensis]|uniref:Uncharacterized protein n=1 Tax=Paenibacillus shirakamiensis TaxID=1265935 RepID=A0ABS4JE42_9BACL|nr:hypothetical protein [Paenibacillus shirakamiensis]
MILIVNEIIFSIKLLKKILTAQKRTYIISPVSIDENDNHYQLILFWIPNLFGKLGDAHGTT